MNRLWVQRGEPAFEAIEQFVSTLIWGAPRPMVGNTAMGVFRDRTLIGAVIFQNYSPEHGTIEMSAGATSARWMTRDTLYDIYSYAFDQMRCQAVVMRCDPEDHRLRRIHTAYGFERYDIPRLRGRDKGEAIYVLGDDVWRNNGFHKENEHG